MTTPDDRSPIVVGDMLHGACMAVFGNGYYGCAKVESVGRDWLVARPVNNDYAGEPMGSSPVFACGLYVVADAARNRDDGLQDSCKSSFHNGCSYDYTHDPEF